MKVRTDVDNTGELGRFIKIGRKAFKISVDIAIIIYLVLITIIVVTGGFRLSFLGMSIRATHLLNPIQILFVLILLRIMISVEWKSSVLLLGSVLFALVTIEILLRIQPMMLGQVFTTKMLSVYHGGAGGIREYDPVLKMDFMKPNFRTMAYWNGYRWLHETDSKGFRNPVDRDRFEIVLLGDSLIYGHGVNHNQTVGYFLEELTGLTVANLARTGDCSFQQAYLLNRYGVAFRPEYVFYFFYNNDITDLSSYLSKVDMRRFVDTPIEKISFPPRSKTTPKNHFLSEGIRIFFEKEFAVKEAIRVVDYYLERNSGWRKRFLEIFSKRRLEPTVAESRNVQMQIDKKPLAPFGKKPANTAAETMTEGTDRPMSNELSLEWQYTRQAILQMNYVSKRNGARFFIVPITFGNEQYFRILRDIATRHGIPLVDARAIDNVPDYRLPNDGHFNETGALAMAEIVSAFIKNQRSLY